MGRPRLPREDKEFRGTISYSDEKKYEAERKAELALKETPSAIFQPGQKVPCPEAITDRYVKNYWIKLTTALIAIGVLSPLDVPQIEQMCVTLQKLREVQKIFNELSPFEEDFDIWEKRYIRLSDKFDQLGSKYYVSPAARSKLRLEDLNIQKTQAELDRQSPLMQLLAGRS